MNNKGFTVVEVVISFTFVIIILASMFAIVINYRNKTTNEEIVTNLVTYKNTILQIVYDDIIKENMESITLCGNKCVDINTLSDTYKLEWGISEDGEEYLSYRENKYVLPDSNNSLATINDFLYRFDTINLVYSVSIPITHAEMTDEENENYTINIVVSGKKFSK